MLRTKIDLWPFGSEAEQRTIADICIANVGKAHDETYTYVYMCETDRNETFKGKVYAHKREDGVFPLMMRVYEMISSGNRVHHFFTEYELRVLDSMEKMLKKSLEA